MEIRLDTQYAAMVLIEILFAKGIINGDIYSAIVADRKEKANPHISQDGAA